MMRSLDEIFRDHVLWLTGQGGEQAVFPKGTMFDGVWPEQARLSFAVFDGCTLRGVCLRFAVLDGCVFRDADLTDADLVGASLVAASFLRTRLVRTCLQSANLRSADLRGADLMRADLRGADLSDTRMSHRTRLLGARVDQNTKFEGVRGLPQGGLPPLVRRGRVVNPNNQPFGGFDGTHTYFD